FFFQAEDGIRDRNVTGVQTCALPISRFGAAGMNVNRLACDIGHDSGGHLGLAAILHADEQDTGCGRHSASLTAERPWAKPVGIRSEERRVGKECRSGRSWGDVMELRR